MNLFRFCLAVFVVAFHIAQRTPWQTAFVAVEGFFCISGFLVTLIVNEAYAGRPIAYLANRFLRIYPVYWACLLIGVAVVTLAPVASLINPAMVAPRTVQAAVPQIVIFGLYLADVRVLPPAWSLSVELEFYLIVGLLTARSFRLTAALVPISATVSVLCAFHILPFPFYGSPIGNADAFFIGSLTWHLRNRFTFEGWKPFAAALSAFLLLAFGPVYLLPDSNSLLAAPVVALVILTGRRLPPAFSGRMARVAAWLGRMAYPVFLLHWPIAGIFFAAFDIHPGWLLFALTIATTSLVSAAVVALVDIPIERVRRGIRDGRAARAIAH